MSLRRLLPSPNATRNALAGGIAALAALAALWLALPSPLPVPLVADASRPDWRTCAECHQEQVADFQTAPHSRTLRRLDDPKLLAAFTERQYHDQGSEADLSWSVQEGRLFVHVAEPPRSMPLDWAFGSGRHAVTPVAVKEN